MMKLMTTCRSLVRSVILVVAVATGAAADERAEADRRVQAVSRVPGFVALWDFVTRDPVDGRFSAVTAPQEKHDFRLDAMNYVREYWGVGREATYADFPLLGRGPFGQAIQIRAETESDFRPLLLAPRSRIHNSGLDVKGPGRSVSMVVWLIRQGGNHAIAGIWHEGTDLRHVANQARRVESGKRQYALFAGLAANNGASAAHVSENGRSSFGDRYARNLSVTPELIPSVAETATGRELDEAWSTVGFVYDNRAGTVTSYLNGVATDYWIDNPEAHPFYQWPAKAWRQAQLRKQPGVQEGEDVTFPQDQLYMPPEDKPRKRHLVCDDAAERVELQEFAFTRVRVTWRKQGGKIVRSEPLRQLVALRVNPFWFGHDLYTPATEADGGPFTIGRVIHTGRNVGFVGYLGGVAVFGRALTNNEMRRLSRVASRRVHGKWIPAPLTTR
jgi:hypothetical protein